MYNIRAVVLASIFLLFQISAAAAQQCQLRQIASLDMIANAPNYSLISLTLSGAPQIMLIDTGGPMGLLAADIADTLKLEPRWISNITFHMTTGQSLQHYVIVPTVNFGPASVKDVEFVLGPPIQVGGKSIAGTIGQDLLRNFDVELDFARKKVNLFSPDHCKGQVVYWAHSYAAMPMEITSDSHIKVAIILDGHEIDGLLDTGTPHTTIDSQFAQKEFGADMPSPALTKMPDGSSRPLYRPAFKDLTLQGINIPYPSIDITSTPSADPLSVPKMILGADVIHQLHLYIAYQERTIYFTPADAH